jgi:hypothetical protein
MSPQVISGLLVECGAYRSEFEADQFYRRHPGRPSSLLYSPISSRESMSLRFTSKAPFQNVPICDRSLPVVVSVAP